MAAFTTFSEDALRRYLVMFGQGELSAFQPISGGIENSNYFITLDDQGTLKEFVLTIVEDLGFDEVPFFNSVTTRLSQHGLPVAAPLATLDGMTSTIFCGKPALLVPRLPGSHPGQTSTSNCETIGEFIASSHQALADLGRHRSNPYSHAWMSATLGSLGQLAPEDRKLMTTIVDEYRELEDSLLPRGVIHGDLFRDNALFSGDGLTGVIDYYHACTDYLIQDLAVTINDWCLTDDFRIDQQRSAALVNGYEKVRKLTDEERSLLPAVQRISAARFALTRFESGDPPLKDPGQMLALARHLAS